jgi:hypothetical protein
MKFNITQLLIIFDELLVPPTNEELGEYWFRAARTDGLIVTLTFSVYENTAGVLIGNGKGTAMANVDMKNCSEIKVLDEKKKCLEIIHENSQGRCFLSLSSDSILDYRE